MKSIPYLFLAFVWLYTAQGCVVGVDFGCTPLSDSFTQAYWMQQTINYAGPCPFNAFCAILVNRTTNTSLIQTCGLTGNPIAHAELSSILLFIQNYAACTALGAPCFQQLTLYATGEPCPMCAGAIRWSRIGEVVWSTPIGGLLGPTPSLFSYGWPQIAVSSIIVDEATGPIFCPYECANYDHYLETTVWNQNVLSSKSLPLFAWQVPYPPGYTTFGPCPAGCTGGSGNCAVL